MTEEGDRNELSKALERFVPDPNNADPSRFDDDADGRPPKELDELGKGGRLAKVFWWFVHRNAPFLLLHRRYGEPAKHPLRRVVCFTLDLVVRLVAVALMLGVLFGLAAKVLLPLPPLGL